MSAKRYRPEHMRLLNDKRWKETKAIVWERAKGLCEWCIRDGIAAGVEGGWIRPGVDCHHLVPFESAKTMQEAERLCYDPNNCVLLCVEHHRAEHNQKGYHTKEHVQARRAERFERWKEKMSGGSTPGGIDFVEPHSDSQIHLPSLESRD